MFAFNTKENNLLMNRFQLGSWFVLFFLALQFTSCDNEPLEGDFPQEEMNTAEEGQFVATIDGQGWIAESTTTTMNEANTLAITGMKSSTGESISITVENAAVGLFDITAGVGTQNSGVFIDAETQMNPYFTSAALGGFGQLELTEINTDSLTITGTFSFFGARIAFRHRHRTSWKVVRLRGIHCVEQTKLILHMPQFQQSMSQRLNRRVGCNPLRSHRQQRFH